MDFELLKIESFELVFGGVECWKKVISNEIILSFFLSFIFSVFLLF